MSQPRLLPCLVGAVGHRPSVDPPHAESARFEGPDGFRECPLVGQSARTKVLALDHATQQQEMKAIAGQPAFSLGSVHAITRDGRLVIASALGSQLASYAWGAAQVCGCRVLIG